MILDLKIPELPPAGRGAGVVGDVLYGTVSDKRGKTYQTVEAIVELAATRSDGVRHVVPIPFKLDLRGRKQLREQLKAWNGGQPLDQFSPEETWLGKPCWVEIEIENRIPRVKGFAPNAQSDLKVSTQFVRRSCVAGKEDVAI